MIKRFQMAKVLDQNVTKLVVVLPRSNRILLLLGITVFTPALSDIWAFIS